MTAEERELSIMQLAAISTAAIQNTSTSVKDRICNDHPYCSTAYQDVCRAVDREMLLINEVRSLRQQLAALREYVREKANPDEILNEPGGIPQINFRAGMVTAYRDIEKRLTEMEKP